MRVAIFPSCTELIIIVNPAGELTRESPRSIIPGLYAPWPDAWEKGIIETEVECETLIGLLTKLSERYKQVGVDFCPAKPGASSVDPDYDVYVNGKDYITLPHDIRLTTGDEVVVRMV